jgi:murein DD-endopeptidase MepM/ murein hydrolase activator NlpD
MRKFIIFRNKVVFILMLITLGSAACGDSPNSNAVALKQDTVAPTPSPSVEPTAASSPTPVVLPTTVISPSPAPSALETPTTTQSPADNPFATYNDAVKNNNTAARDNNTAAAASSGKLMIPVIGVKHEDLRDTFNAARSEGRVHDAIDIIAVGGTPVVAATDGKIVKFFDSVRGGITVYQLGPDEHTVYYYAHLQRRADNLRENTFVKQGTLIGYVGDTGNSGAGNYHLHFAIWTVTDPKHFYDGTNINPYPLLKEGKIATQ